MSMQLDRRLLLFLVAVLALISAVDAVAVLRITNNHDFAVYYRAAQRLLSGQDIYAEIDSFRAHIEQGLSTAREDTPWPFSTPPFHALVTAPLTILPYGWAAGVWTALCLCAIAASLCVVLASQRLFSLIGLAIALLLLYQYQPAVVAVRLGQIDIMIFLLIVLALYWLKQGAHGRAGLALGLAIGVKVFAGFLVLFLLWKRQWTAALWAMVSGALCLLGSFALVGFDGLRRYLDFSTLYTWGSFAGYPYHQSINAFLARTLKPNSFLAPVADLPWLADALTLLATVLLTAGLAWLTRRPTPPANSRFELEYALVLCTMLLVLPPAPRYAFIWLLFGFLVVAARFLRGDGSTWLAALAALSYVLSARLIYLPIPLVRRLVMDGQFMLSALLLWGVVALLLARNPKGLADL